ncbi:MAG: 3-deoxy-D-manno-octulosonic acid transferase [Deltaproteobacteria bacterium]|nr:3-deoxy-D-manno-octulosonic acid transferase [Deltaproteobacteria bacterium]
MRIPGVTILLFFYHIVFSCVVLVLIPLFPFMRGKRIKEKLGLGLKGGAPFRAPVWVHALSVGEVLSAIPLLDVLKEKYPENDLIFSATTRQGIALAREKVGDKVKALIPMPMDFWWSVRRALHAINPAVFVLIETDIWPGFLSAARKKKVKCLLVNGRISPKTYSFYKKCSFLVRKMFGVFDRCLMQTDLDRDRLLAIGVDREKVQAVGNIKFDCPWAPMEDTERARWMAEMGIRKGNSVIVGGSTHPGEEVIILRVYKRVLEKFPELRLLLAPRKIERADDILKLAQDKGFVAMLKTKMANNPGEYDVLIVDTLGELGRIYGLARISFVGGSLVPFGGHNLLEPASFGCPVLFGAHTENFVRMSEELIRAGGGWRVQDEEQLEEAVLSLLQDRDLCRDMGERAREFVLGNKGALTRVVAEIDQFLIQKREESRWG